MLNVNFVGFNYFNQINMDYRSWMYCCRRDCHIFSEFIAGVRRFINFAFSIDENVSGGKIRCPCLGVKIKSF